MEVENEINIKIVNGLEEIDQVVELQTEIWSRDTVTTLPQLVAAIHNGGVVLGAFANEQLVGFCYGFAGFKDGESYLISHMTGILPNYQNFGIGYQLKLKQREWAIDYGYKKMVWTFDPLEVRNGYFNFCKLGAHSNTYIPSYYGMMSDKLNKGLPTDRLLVEWDLCSNRVESSIEAPIKTENEYKILLDWEEKEGAIYPAPLVNPSDILQKGYRVAAPTHFQSIKQRNPEGALVWRYAVREALSKAFSSGYFITGVQRGQSSNTHYYILEHNISGGMP